MCWWLAHIHADARGVGGIHMFLFYLHHEGWPNQVSCMLHFSFVLLYEIFSAEINVKLNLTETHLTDTLKLNFNSAGKQPTVQFHAASFPLKVNDFLGHGEYVSA